MSSEIVLSAAQATTILNVITREQDRILLAMRRADNELTRSYLRRMLDETKVAMQALEAQR